MESKETRPRLPVPLPDSDDASGNYLGKLNHYLALSFSIPERVARALGAIVGGSTLLLTKTLFPKAVKNSNSYRFTFGMFQTFLIRQVAQLDHFPEQEPLPQHFLNRKLLGTTLEAAGLFTVHLSPVWVFAIASDAAKGGQVFLNRLVHHLKENEVIAQERNPETLEQVLLAIHEMSRHGATAIDTPPLSMAELEELAAQLRESTSSLSRNAVNLIPSFESIWSQINQVASKERLSAEQVMGILSVSAASIKHTGVGAAGAVGKTGFHFLDEVVLTDYRDTLAEIAETGSLMYMQNNMQLFMRNAQSHFDFKKETRSQLWFREGIEKLLKQLPRKK